MAITTTFGPLSTAQMSQLDANFSFVGLLGVLPCAAAGTNAITLTPNANSIAVVAYASYSLFSFIQVATTTSAVTLQVGSLPLLNVYLQDGTAAGANSLVINQHYIVMYDLALNGGAGGFVIMAGQTVQNYQNAQRGQPVTLVSASSITPDFSAGNNFAVTLGTAATLANPNNLVGGQSGQIVITQDGIGSRTMAYGNQWKFSGGSAPTLSTAAGAVDQLVYYTNTSALINATLVTNLH